MPGVLKDIVSKKKFALYAVKYSTYFIVLFDWFVIICWHWHMNYLLALIYKLELIFFFYSP